MKGACVDGRLTWIGFLSSPPPEFALIQEICATFCDVETTGLGNHDRMP
jgi:hypothetical protein